MKLSFERSGGFAGMRMSGTLELDELDQMVADELRQLVQDTDFFNLPEKIISDTPSADQFQYKVTVTTDLMEHTVYLENTTPSEALNALIRKMMEVARSQNQ